jgi:tRNA (cytidine/uridine-2'-O-)-methyltransferase
LVENSRIPAKSNVPSLSGKIFFITMHRDSFHIVLVEPEIPPNTGSIARLCGSTDTVLDLVHPLGFSTDDKHLKRAGLDYWPYVTIRHWDTFDAFLQAQDERKLFFFTTKSDRPYYQASFSPGACLIFGRETKGLPEEILALYHEHCYTIPMTNKNIRSLNLAMCAGIVLYEALRQFQEVKQ